jgi:hypothetical protein
MASFTLFFVEMRQIFAFFRKKLLWTVCSPLFFINVQLHTLKSLFVNKHFTCLDLTMGKGKHIDLPPMDNIYLINGQ